MNTPVPLPDGARAVAPEARHTTLDDLKPGERGVVLSVGGEGTLRGRLLDMGFVSGTAIRVVRLAPLADPMEIELHGYHLTLRRAAARTVFVERS